MSFSRIVRLRDAFAAFGVEEVELRRVESDVQRGITAAGGEGRHGRGRHDGLQGDVPKAQMQIRRAAQQLVDLHRCRDTAEAKIAEGMALLAGQ